MERTETLDRLGDALEAATRRTVAAHKRPRRGIVAAAVAAVVLVPAAAIAGAKLISNGDVASSLPAGTLSLAGTEPTCTTVKGGVEYRCVLAKAPAPEVSDWKGTVEPTVDATKHVNGGCRSLRADGLEWQCYLGQTAVDEQIIGPGFLGEYSSGPGVG